MIYATRRTSDRAFRVVVIALLGALLLANLSTYRSLGKAVTEGAASRKELYRRLDASYAADESLDKRLSLLSQELKVLEANRALLEAKQRNWLAALEQPTKDRARQK